MENTKTYNNYQEMKNAHQTELNAFPLGFAFSDAQFNKMMLKWNLDPEKDIDKIYSIGIAGGYIRKSDTKAFEELNKRFRKEEKLFKKNYKKLVDMLVYEMGNHEYCITYDLTETLEACGYSMEDLKTDKTLIKAVNEARRKYLRTI